eukprot:8992617-Pyramimonas_sp.AAC.1
MIPKGSADYSHLLPWHHATSNICIQPRNQGPFLRLASVSGLHLRGLPTPIGRHTRDVLAHTGRPGHDGKGATDRVTVQTKL